MQRLPQLKENHLIARTEIPRVGDAGFRKYGVRRYQEVGGQGSSPAGNRTDEGRRQGAGTLRRRNRHASGVSPIQIADAKERGDVPLAEPVTRRRSTRIRYSRDSASG